MQPGVCVCVCVCALVFFQNGDICMITHLHYEDLWKCGDFFQVPIFPCILEHCRGPKHAPHQKSSLSQNVNILVQTCVCVKTCVPKFSLRPLWSCMELQNTLKHTQSLYVTYLSETLRWVELTYIFSVTCTWLPFKQLSSLRILLSYSQLNLNNIIVDYLSSDSH